MTAHTLAELVTEAVDPFLSLGDASVRILVHLDVLSDHDVYLDDDGRLAGMFLATNHLNVLGTSLILDVRLPWGELMVVEGTVEWILEPSRTTLRHRKGVGLKFVELLPQQQDLLNRALLLREPIKVPAGVRRS